jgi:O-antigen/teichoic acid export membrane protein
VSVCVLLVAFVCWQAVLRTMALSCVPPPPQTSINREFYGNCFSLWGIACLVIVMGQGPQVLLGLLSSAEQVAYFAVASRIAMLVSFVLLAINGILSPKFAEVSAQQDTPRLQQLYRSSTRLMIVLTCPFLLLIFIFSPEVLLLFGSDYQQASSVLRVLIAAQFVKVMVGSVGQLLIMTNLQRHQRNNLILSVVILLGLIVYLVPMYGALGAAIACFFAITCNNMLGLFQVYKKLNIRMF